MSEIESMLADSNLRIAMHSSFPKGAKAVVKMRTGKAFRCYICKSTVAVGEPNVTVDSVEPRRICMSCAQAHRVSQ